jgi:hypothetical protein
LTPRADDRDAGPRQHVEVGRFVPAVARVTVHAADAAGGEHADARARRELGGGRDRRPAVRAARGRRREVAQAALDDILAPGERGQLLVIDADPHLAGDNRDRGRHGTGLPDRLLDLPRDLQIPRPGQPVGHDRALERDDRPAAGERLGNLRRRPHAQASVSTRTEKPSARAASSISSLFSGPRVWSTSLIAVSRTWISIPSRRCSTSTTLPP